MGEQSWEQEVLDVAAGTKASDALERPGRQLHHGQPDALRASGGEPAMKPQPPEVLSFHHQEECI